jgi:anaerobic selenocysteine-containing dehydrogenase
VAVRHSVCALDCPDTCSLLINVEDGVGTRLRGNPDHPVTRGFLCGKVARYLEREYSPDRLLYPRRRVGAKGEGRFERISWDDALDTIAERLRAVAAEFGPEAILPYTGGSSTGWAHRNWTAPSARRPAGPGWSRPRASSTAPSPSRLSTRS